MSNPLVLIAFGVIVGVFSGVMGLGGGSVMIPIMVLAYHMSQQRAHGTSLAVMLPMVTLPAVIEYYRHGNVDVRMAIWMAVGFMLGSFFGAYFANAIRPQTLKLIFGFLLIYVAAYTVFGKDNTGRTTALSILLVVIAMGIFAVTKWQDRRITSGPAAPAAASPAAAGQGAQGGQEQISSVE